MFLSVIKLLRELKQLVEGHPDVEVTVKNDEVIFTFTYEDGSQLTCKRLSQTEIKYAEPNDILYYLVYQVSELAINQRLGENNE